MLSVILYRQSVKFQRKILIPRPILPFLDLEGESELYFYVYVDGNALSIAMSINEPVELDHVVYTSKGKVGRKSAYFFVQRDLLDIFDLDGKYLLWEVHDEKPELRFKFAKPLQVEDDYLNRILSGIVSYYDADTHKLLIPERIFEVKEFEEKDKIFCCLYRHKGRFVILLNNRSDEIESDEYDLAVIFMGHIEYVNDEVYLELDISLREYLKLTQNEEICWSTYYDNGTIYIGFERTFTNVVKMEYSGLVSNIFLQNLNMYTKVPEEVVSLLRLYEVDTVLWKRYKQGKICRIAITQDKPRFYRDRKSGKIMEKVPITEEGIIPIPKVLIDRFELTTDNFIYWRINEDNKRYRFAIMEFY